MQFESKTELAYINDMHVICIKQFHVIICFVIFFRLSANTLYISRILKPAIFLRIKMSNLYCLLISHSFSISYALGSRHHGPLVISAVCATRNRNLDARRCFSADRRKTTRTAFYIKC